MIVVENFVLILTHFYFYYLFRDISSHTFAYFDTVLISLLLLIKQLWYLNKNTYRVRDPIEVDWKIVITYRFRNHFPIEIYYIFVMLWSSFYLKIIIIFHYLWLYLIRKWLLVYRLLVWCHVHSQEADNLLVQYSVYSCTRMNGSDYFVNSSRKSNQNFVILRQCRNSKPHEILYNYKILFFVSVKVGVYLLEELPLNVDLHRISITIRYEKRTKLQAFCCLYNSLNFITINSIFKTSSQLFENRKL